ncbi:hypothetical protein GCM10007304_18100 [Rhodococcoides trifolii]|uniref:DUF1508 domain-containing protein n=1 Tax=Rhodococcoides trifolii TaxID=908250 RepID=A0A917CYE9_9NOCA|nr:DUF1508 domain-containing protein [Rhodococcus trifolii]GGG04371.1 hypothetical protein GCM10007304_18100 [Rhodococcus trifolii]
MAARKVDVEFDGIDGWTWTLFASNGGVLAKGGQTFTRRADAVKAARRALDQTPTKLRTFERDGLVHELHDSL